MNSCLFVWPGGALQPGQTCQKVTWCVCLAQRSQPKYTPTQDFHKQMIASGQWQAGSFLHVCVSYYKWQLTSHLAGVGEALMSSYCSPAKRFHTWESKPIFSSPWKYDKPFQDSCLVISLRFCCKFVICACFFQVAEMHGELIEFNERLYRSLMAKDNLIGQMRQELIDLRGPVRTCKHSHACNRSYIQCLFMPSLSLLNRHSGQIIVFYRSAPSSITTYLFLSQYTFTHPCDKKNTHIFLLCAWVDLFLLKQCDKTLTPFKSSHRNKNAQQ